MTPTRLFSSILSLPLIFAALACAQDSKVAESSTTPPHLLVLVHQEFQHGKSSARQKLEVSMNKAWSRLNVPNYWIDLESITGSPEALFFDPFDSYEQMEKSIDEWNQLYTAHPELAKMREEINGLLTSERTVVAERRDDISYRQDTIDLSEARFMRVVELHYSAGHEGDFIQTFKILGAAYEKAKSETPWVVYQVNMGNSSPSFIIFIPMATLKQNDSVLPWTEGFLELEGEEDSQQLQQIARDSFAGSESNLYAISPEMSHVSKKFATGAGLTAVPRLAAPEKPVQQENASSPANDQDPSKPASMKVAENSAEQQ
jgi:hypothetical protein